MKLPKLFQNANGITAILVIVMLAITGTLVVKYNHSEAAMPVDVAELAQDTASPCIRVHVKGNVRHPDVYELSSGMRVNDAISAAGGITEGGSMDSVNLAAYLSDGMEISVLPEATEAPIEKVTAGGKVNVNTAGKAELMTLPGIGDAYSSRIIEYRNTHGAFRRPEDLLNISGIGEKRLENMRAYLEF